MTPEILIEKFKKAKNIYQKKDIALAMMVHILKNKDIKWEPNEYRYEEWKEVKGFEGLYEISNYGRFKMLPRVKCYSKLGKPFMVKGRIKQFSKNLKHYPGTTFVKDGKYYHVDMHVLVGIHFIPNPENKPFVNHIDGDKCNNWVNNLEWNTIKENNIHARIKGLNNTTGDRNTNAKLTNQQAVEIFKSVLPYKELGEKYSVSKHTICKIKCGESWNGVTGKNKTSKRRRIFTNEEIISIYESNKSQYELAKIYKTDQSCISSIKRRIVHKQLTENLIKGSFRKKKYI